MITSMRRRGVIVLSALLMLTGGHALVTAEEQTDTMCVLEPRTLPLFGATPAATIAATPVADGAAVEASEAEIEAAVAEIVACINTGEARFVFAIYTDRYLAEQLAHPEEVYQPEIEAAIDRNVVEAVDQFTLDAIDAIEPLEDGRVAVTIALSTDASFFHDTLILAQVNGTWLIDGVQELDPPA